MVIDILSGFKGITPFKGITLDDGWDQINRSFMFVLCVLMGTVVTVRQYAGGIISCDGFTKYSSSFAEDYCWTQGLYTIKEAYDLLLINVPYPGVIPEDLPACIERDLYNGGKVSCPDPEDVKPPTRVYHLWYQWVPFYFWLAAAAFFFPYLIYKHFGVGDLKPLIQMLHNPICDEGDQNAMSEKASMWLFYKLNVFMNENTIFAVLTEKHRLFFIVMITKSMYLIISIMALYLTDEMFEIGSFISYGSEWATKLPVGDNETTLIKDKLFPKMVACEIKRWGPTGIEEEQGMCVLAPNVINQYLFLILWFAIIFAIACNCLSVLFALTKLVFVLGSYKRLLASAFLKDELHYKHMFFNIGTSGRVLLQIVATNVSPRIFEGIMANLASKLIAERLKGNGKGSV